MQPNNGGGPQWANPQGTTQQQATAVSLAQQEEAFFAPLSTLDEPVRETIMRDVRSVASKLKVVLLPMDRTIPYGGYAGVSQTENIELTDRDKQIIESLRDWDLWGPLIVCLGLAVLLSFNAPVGQASLVFATVFCAVWLGAAVVTINTQLLGGTISFFQSVCVLGYGVFPMTMAAVVVLLFKMLPLGAFSVLVEVAVLFVAFLWSTRASSVFIGQYIVASRRVLAVFPVLFFYTFLAWLVLLF
ncbi:Yip1 domain containing protein [Nitzschia inconspicua]|uniref:Protein YIPF n=1 Tax=Nitzschia inconspicua TaxID=303405 RepID=A0A9K3PGV2_9STRA|nr:Yip1 domain containing protein [Nitzschia inconspicua]